MMDKLEKRLIRWVFLRFWLKYPLKKIVKIKKYQQYYMIEAIWRFDYRKRLNYINRRFESTLYIYNCITGKLSHELYVDYLKEFSEARRNSKN